MAWEIRARGGRYYTRSRREGGRVVREYIGTGRAAETYDFLAACERARLAEERAEREAYRHEHDALDGPLDTFYALVANLTRESLLAAGYHQHKREWRKRHAKAEGHAVAAG